MSEQKEIEQQRIARLAIALQELVDLWELDINGRDRSLWERALAELQPANMDGDPT